MRLNRFSARVFVAAASVVIAGCAGKVTGGGSLIGTAGHGSFGVTADSCGKTTKGQFEYVDHDSVVKLHGDVVGAGQCVAGLTTCDCQALVPGFGLGFADYEIDSEYRSTNPQVPGGGHVIACVSDNGEGSKATGADNASIHVVSGPFTGYNNIGYVQGNIQQHKCPGKTGSQP